MIVYPPSECRGRRVRLDERILGLAHGPRAILVLLRQAGLRPRVRDLWEGELVEWRGGGPDLW
ncbi:hypothetical protein OIE69_00835 [Actinacidiphila glaucinigra]|nr:hypothetical protein OIE69_00835 [Actinacidiphila glaucinigra]